MKLLKLLMFAIALAFTAFPVSNAQGVTTSSIKGRVSDNNGNAVYSATVVAVHLPSGTQYGTFTLSDGGFLLRNMKIGGPYELKISFVGYEEYMEQEIYLSLNKTSEFNISLTESTVELKEITVTYDKVDVINSDRTGSMTNINSDAIIAMPSIKRRSLDLTRLTPESNGNSFGGRNNLYNNFSLDGSIFNNSFGLDYATPGGQTDAQPVSIEAIEQIQVSLAPFDVREGGFTGAGVNAVTKSGTNEFKGTAYYFFRNENMIGQKVGEITAPNLDFSTSLYGFSVGGPILKNKLFFYINAEAERRNELAHGYIADDGLNTGQANVTSVIEDSIQMVQDYLRTYWNYEPGAYQNYYHETFNNKLLAKLNWNVNKNNNITLRYNMLDSWKDILPHPEAIIGRGPTTFRLPFENSSYRIFNKIHSLVGELHSIFSTKLSNKLLLGYTGFRDNRQPFSEPYPVIDIFDANGNLAITMGSEMFSTQNILNQDVFQVTDNITYYTENHTLTGGLNFELFQFENSFNLFYYPWNTFGSVASFLANDRSGIDFDAQVAANSTKPLNWSYVDVGQLALYVQDEFQVTEKLNLTFGLRTDLPMYFSDVVTETNSDAIDVVENFNGWVNENGDPAEVKPSEWPKGVIMWSPRFGFNYDVRGDATMQIRGGSGIFSGRIPFVWLGNQAGNAGMFPGYSFQVNATAKGYHWPQVWKNNIAFDYKFGDGWLSTVEAMYSKDINAVVHRNYNMAPPSQHLGGTGDDRAIFAGFNEVNIYSSSAGSIGFLDAGAIVMDNTKEGYQLNLTVKVSKRFDFGLFGDLAYSYLDSKDYTSIPAEIAADAFQRNPVIGNPNKPMLSWSRYGLKHRFVGSLLYRKAYKSMASAFALFYEAGKGNRYSYVYAGDLNQDAIFNNDLLYVPEDQSDIHFGTVVDGVGVPAANAAAQWTAFNTFIENDPYLSTRRGDYAMRNGAMLPWFSQVDVRVMQDLYFKIGGKVNTVQVSLDILNFGNLISSNWGVRQIAKTFTPVSFSGVDANNTPWFQYDTRLTEPFSNDVSINSKWQMQLGIKYIFN